MSARARRGAALAALVLALLGCACSSGSESATGSLVQMHSSALAVSSDGARLFVAHPDADSVSLLELSTRRILHERALGTPPHRDAAGRYEPSVAPRALALNAAGNTLYVTGQRSGHLYALDATSLEMTMRSDVSVCSEPIGVLVSADDASVFVACSQDDEIVQLSARDLRVLARVPCARKPWALAWAGDGETLLATHLLGPGLSSFSTDPLAARTSWPLEDGAQLVDAGLGDEIDLSIRPHGVVRAIYDAMLRPGSSELWVAHLMLGTDTPQPALDFQRTAFPALSILDRSGAQLARLSIQTDPAQPDAFGDVVSGPHALAFSRDGKLAFSVDANSEDVLVIDAEQRVETQLVRPLPGHMPESIVWARDKLYVQERNTEDIAVLRVESSASGKDIVLDGPPIESLTHDPMPAELRLGQKLFYSANSDDVPMTQNHWLACATCHLEGRSDGVTWKFSQGLRDTPTNAGGMLDTGFLFRTADRTRVQDYWQTIDTEQGGHVRADEASQAPLLDALAAFVNYAIPTPQPPSTDATHTIEGEPLRELRAQGRAVFERVHCDGCHSGAALTDSGAGNEMLDLSGPIVTATEPGGVLLHDVGTCVDEGDATDVAHQDIQGHARDACAFDTPQLRGLSDSAPYLHDGSAATLGDTLPSMLRAAASPDASAAELTDEDRQALVEYLRSL